MADSTADTMLADRGPSAFAIATAMLALSAVFVAARLVCRIGLVRRIGWDDYFIVLAWLFALGLGVAIALATHRGLGRHDRAIAPGDRGVLRRCEYVFSILYNPALMATKTSILIFYLRLSQNTQALLRLASFAVLGVVNIAGTVLTLINIFQCRPVAAGFSDAAAAAAAPAHCIPLLTEFICSAPVNIVTDLAILALPLPVLTGMRLPPRQKTILVLTFALGIFVTIVDVVRICYLQEAISDVSAASTTPSSSDPLVLFGEGSDFSWNAALSFMWSAVEVNVGIICACIPTLKPLIIRILPAMLVDPGNRSDDAGDRHDASISNASNSKPGHARNFSGALPRLSFLTLPETGTAVGTPRSSSAIEGIRRPFSALVPRRRPAAKKKTYFGFINMERPKNMLDVSATASFRYCTTVAVLFFLWGFSYGLLNMLNNAVANVADMTSTQTLGLTSAYFGGGYLFGPPLVGVWVLRHDEHHRREHAAVGRAVASATAHHHHHHHHHQSHPPGHKYSPSTVEDSIGGFKATFMVGLCVYGVGTIMFWPSAVLASFPGFLISSFVVGFGLSVLETAANPFLVLCGPPAYAEMRLLLAQGAQGIASVLSSLLAQRVFFSPAATASFQAASTSTTPTTLLNVQWTYLAITLFCAALALFFYYMPLPEVRDADLARAVEKQQDQAEHGETDAKPPADGGGDRQTRRPWWHGTWLWQRPWPLLELRTVCLVLAVFSQWTYVAAQECMSIYFHPLIVSWLPPASQTASAVTAGSGDHTVVRRLSVSGFLLSMATSGMAPGSDQDHPAGLAVSVSNYLLICRTAFAVSRFGAAALVYVGIRWRRWRRRRWLLLPLATPRAVLLGSTALMALSALLLVVLPRPRSDGADPNLLMLPTVLFFLAEGPVWPLMFALGLRGQGTRTKRAGAYITMGASGPLFWPFVMNAATRASASASSSKQARRRSSTQMAFIVVVVLAAASTVYPLYLTLSRGGRRMSRVAVERESRGGEEEGGEPPIVAVDAPNAQDPVDSASSRRSSSSDAQESPRQNVLDGLLVKKSENQSIGKERVVAPSVLDADPRQRPLDEEQGGCSGGN